MYAGVNGRVHGSTVTVANAEMKLPDIGVPGALASARTTTVPGSIRTANVGFGMLARINPGTVMTFSRRFVNGEVWLPARADYTIKARVLMLKRYLQGGTIEFSNYRKFTVDTATTIAAPAQ